MPTDHELRCPRCGTHSTGIVGSGMYGPKGYLYSVICDDCGLKWEELSDD